METVPFTGTPALDNLDCVASLATPDFRRFSGSFFALWGKDENFAEWAPGYLLWTEMSATWRPTERVRVEGLYNETRVVRPTDWSVVNLTRVPRLKVEYQLFRSVFLRVVGQYVAREQDALRDDGRTDRPLLQLDSASGAYAPIGARSHNELRFDWLFSYQPNPGTVVFAGYGSTLEDRAAFRFDGLARRQDAFFLKLSYLFRA